MKFVDLINESFTPDAKQLKHLKNAKVIYRAYKEGAIKYERSVTFANDPDRKEEFNTVVGYKLGEPQYEWRVNQKNTREMYLLVTIKNIIVYIKDPALYDVLVVNPVRGSNNWIHFVNGTVRPVLINRFNAHGVKLHVNEAKIDFVFVEPKETKDPEQINEDPTVGEQNRLTDKEMKNFKALWTSFKEGVFKYNDKKYRYQLKNEHDVFKMPSTAHASSRIVVLINGAFESSIRVYEIQDNGHNVLLDYGLENRLYSLVKAKVKKNFVAHNVHLHL